jgi:hypothetical protein
MIPHRVFSHEISGSGLRERVTACRKRLRVNRAAQKPHALNESDELFPEATSSVSEFHNYSPGYPAKNNGMVLLTEEQEVGIR